jgi:hypothetical protein
MNCLCSTCRLTHSRRFVGNAYLIMEGLPVIWEPFAEEDVALSVGEARSAKCKWHGNPRRERPF